MIEDQDVRRISHNVLNNPLGVAVVRGDILVANSTPAMARKAVGAANTVLSSNGTDPSYTQVSTAMITPGSNGDMMVTTGGAAAWVAQSSIIPAVATYVVKPADETVNNSATLQNDDDLFFAMAANTSYFVELLLLLKTVTTPCDYKIGWTVPSGCTMFWGPDTRGSNVRYWDGSVVGGVAAILLLETDNVTMGTALVGNVQGLRVTGIVRNGANAGNLQFQWAQGTATAVNSSVLKDSFLRIMRLQ